MSEIEQARQANGGQLVPASGPQVDALLAQLARLDNRPGTIDAMQRGLNAAWSALESGGCLMGCAHKVTGSACHCAACHLTFSSVSAFDRHQRMSGEGKIICLDPVVARDSRGREIWTLNAARGIWALASHGYTWRPEVNR